MSIGAHGTPSAMAWEYKTTRLVEFADTDMAGILHFSNFFRFMEATEHEFFRSLGFSVHSKGADGTWGAARVQAECQYSAPLRYEDVVELHLLVRKKGRSSISYEVVFRKLIEGATGPEVARGTMTVVFLGEPEANGKLVTVPIPPAVDAVLEVAPE